MTKKINRIRGKHGRLKYEGPAYVGNSYVITVKWKNLNDQNLWNRF